MAAMTVMHCTTQLEDNSSLVICPSDLTRGQENHLITLALPVLEQGELVIDMSRVETIDAAGISTLVFLRQCADRVGATLALVNPSRRVREMLALVHLDSIFLA